MSARLVPESIQITVEKLVAGGEGLSRHQGKIVLTPYVLPGEVILAEIIEDKTQYLRARAAKILNPSPYRISPDCAHFKKCGGCDWLHIDYSRQGEFKKEIIRDSFRRIGKMELPEFEMIPSSPFGYRNRAAFHISQKGIPGFMEKNSNQIVAIDSCKILYPPLDLALQNLRRSPRKEKKISAFAQEDSCFLQTKEMGRQTIEITISGKLIKFNLNCFFQSNLEKLPPLIDFALGGLSGKTAMDLFCGVGLFGAFMRDSFEKIVAVEINREALSFARTNIPGPQHEFYGVDVDKIPPGKFPPGSIDTVLVDPPRNGLTSSTRQFLAQLAPTHLIYVSCNPVTQARDAKDLLKNGFQIEEFRAFDFYPQTFHIETVLKLKCPSTPRPG